MEELSKTELKEEFDRIISILRNNGYILDIFRIELNSLKEGIKPASIKHHHNYDYGLLKHTVEVCQILEKISDMYQLNKYILLSAGLIHDLGKLYEYEIENGIWVKCDTGNINHTQYIYSILKHKGYNNLADIIGTHMGKKEWGAIRDIENIKDKYNWALHLADMMSAKLG